MGGKAPIRLSSVTKRWGSRTVLHSITGELQSSSIYAITGRSGVGKSTFLNVLAGYVKPDGGRVYGEGELAYLFQDEMLFSTLTVRQNIEVLAGPKAASNLTEQVVKEALSSVGLDSLIDARVDSLSGGERRRIELAAIATRTPQVLLLDEPTAALDSDTCRAVAAILGTVFARCCIVVVTHDPELLDALPNACVLQLDSGRIYDVARHRPTN